MVKIIVLNSLPLFFEILFLQMLDFNTISYSNYTYLFYLLSVIICLKYFEIKIITYTL